MAADRRSMVMASLAASALATRAHARSLDLPALEGEIRFDEVARDRVSDDFGHIVHRSPNGVLLPASAADVAATIRWASRNALHLAARGRGHSVFGRAMARAGIVADMSRLRTIHRITAHSVEVDAGTTWRELLTATLPLGLTPPVLPDYLDLSVGGTLSVGGVGGTGSRYGVASDNVLALQVASGSGRLVDCSPHRLRSLFDAVRAGLGQVGVITRATLRLVPAPRQVRQFQLLYPDLRRMLHDQRLLAREGRFDALRGAILAAPAGGWLYRIDAAYYLDGTPPDDNALLQGLADDPAKRQTSTVPYLDHLDRLAALEALLRANGQWFLPHPWLTTFLGDAAVETAVAAELARLRPDADLGPFGQVVLSAFRRDAVSTPLLRLPADRLCYAFNLIRIPATGDALEVRRLVRANRAVYARVRSAGGTLYPVAALPMSARDWRRHFGPAFAGLHAAKREFDPGGVLTPGYAVFRGGPA